MTRTARQPDTAIDHFGFAQWDTPDFCDPVNQTPHNRNIAGQINALKRNQLALFAGQYACVLYSQEPEANFTEVSSFSDGRGASRHGVFFGSLAVQTELEPPITSFIAVKPYDARRIDLKMRPAEAVMHDWAVNTYLDSISSGAAYQPIGLWRGRDTYFVPRLLTSYRERATSLDNIFMSTGRDATPKKAKHGMLVGSFGLGLAHGARMTHGDAFPQNFAIDGGRRIIFNDTTTIRRFSKKQSVVVSLTQEDIEDFMSGVLRPEVSSSEMRVIASEAMRDSVFRSWLNKAYVDGALIGARRAGYDTSGYIVPESDHYRIIDKVLQSYKIAES